MAQCFVLYDVTLSNETWRKKDKEKINKESKRPLRMYIHVLRPCFLRSDWALLAVGNWRVAFFSFCFSEVFSLSCSCLKPAFGFFFFCHLIFSPFSCWGGGGRDQLCVVLSYYEMTYYFYIVSVKYVAPNFWTHYSNLALKTNYYFPHGLSIVTLVYDLSFAKVTFLMLHCKVSR